MQPHQQRVVDELADVRSKRAKLGTFCFSLENQIFNKLPADEQDRLRKQYDIMVQYEGILQERIDHFPA